MPDTALLTDAELTDMEAAVTAGCRLSHQHAFALIAQARLANRLARENARLRMENQEWRIAATMNDRVSDSFGKAGA